jgi:hypothetical protein
MDGLYACNAGAVVANAMDATLAIPLASVVEIGCRGPHQSGSSD